MITLIFCYSLLLDLIEIERGRFLLMGKNEFEHLLLILQNIKLNLIMDDSLKE